LELELAMMEVAVIVRGSLVGLHEAVYEIPMQVERHASEESDTATEVVEPSTNVMAEGTVERF
jgi:hypothetical protein